MDPTTALTAAIENSKKVASTPLFSTVIDRLLGFKISEWNAQGETIKKQILDGYEEAKSRGLGIQYVSAFRANTNLINVGAKAARYIKTSKDNKVGWDNDVFWGLLEHSKDISNEEMQDLIAKIIAGEYNKPGTYSMSTLQVLKMLGKNELELFQDVGSLIINGSEIPLVLFQGGDDVKDLMKHHELDFELLQSLQSLGLILPNEMERTIYNQDKKQLYITYFDKKIRFIPEEENFVQVRWPNHFGLSSVGKQIMLHLKPTFSQQYYKWIIDHYNLPHYKKVL